MSPPPSSTCAAPRRAASPASRCPSTAAISQDKGIAMQLIEHEQTGHKGAFFVEEEGKRLAELSYTMAGTKVIIDHTDVDDALRGTGTGRKLVAAAVDWAREEDLLLLPLCPFARSVFDKTPEYADVLVR